VGALYVKDMTITVGSLFTGIGGLDLGLERAGMEIRWMVEINPFCQKVLAKHWPNVTRYEDVKECGKHNLETVDLICGGFPCQPHSTAGKRRGAADDRNLWPEYLRIVTELRPTWILGENVPGIISTMLDTVLSDLENEGYETLPLVVPACAFDAPHVRRRVWILAHSTSKRNGEESRSMAESKREAWDSPPEEFSCGGQTAPANVADTTGNGCRRHEPVNGRPAQKDRETSSLWTASVEMDKTSRSIRDEGPARWQTEPLVGRVADGVPNRVDRLRALGNAVVPQVAEWIGKQILNYERFVSGD